MGRGNSGDKAPIQHEPLTDALIELRALKDELAGYKTFVQQLVRVVKPLDTLGNINEGKERDSLTYLINLVSLGLNGYDGHMAKELRKQSDLGREWVERMEQNPSDKETVMVKVSDDFTIYPRNFIRLDAMLLRDGLTVRVQASGAVEAVKDLKATNEKEARREFKLAVEYINGLRDSVVSVEFLLSEGFAVI